MGLFDLSGVVSSLGTEVVSIARYLRDTYDSHGIAYPRTEDGPALTPRCSIQPIAGADLKLVPEALHSSDNQSIWCPVPLKMGDLITCAAGVYKVFKLVDWGTSGNYCKALMTKLGEDEGG